MERYNNTDILKTEYTNRPYYKGKFYPNVPLSESDVFKWEVQVGREEGVQVGRDEWN